MTRWQQLLLDICDARQQPHAYIEAPLGLAQAIRDALADESLCLCARCPDDVWTDTPTERMGCRMCANDEHYDPGL